MLQNFDPSPGNAHPTSKPLPSRRTSGGISLASSLLLVWCGGAAILPVQAQPPRQPAQAVPGPTQSPSAPVFYINPSTGEDRPTAGTTAIPYRTITYALQQAAPNAILVLAPGTYSAQSGESFPLQLLPGMTLQGNPPTKGANILITGGGELASSSFGKQNATIRAARDSKIQGISVTNPNQRGTGIWVESTNPLISDSTFTGNQREGIFVTGRASPTIQNNLFINNSANGLAVVSTAQGEIRNNEFRQTGFGMAIGGQASPKVISNLFVDNRAGLVLSDSARPVLRQNQFINNQESGIVLPLFSQAQPDLGTLENPGNNLFQGNGQYGIYNAARNHLIVAVGNQLDASQVSGQVNLLGTPAGLFADVAGNWAAPYIGALAEQKIVGGFPDRTFRPDAPVTRAQFATILQKAFKLQPGPQRTNFQDVPQGLWAANAIQSVVANGFMAGYPNNVFRPNQEISRVQVIVALAQGLNLKTDNLTPLSTYEDASQIPAYARPAVAAATQRGMVVNHPNPQALKPLQNATRAEVAALVYQALANPPVSTAE